jgi:hypothetical protein
MRHTPILLQATTAEENPAFPEYCPKSYREENDLSLAEQQIAGLGLGHDGRYGKGMT